MTNLSAAQSLQQDILAFRAATQSLFAPSKKGEYFALALSGKLTDKGFKPNSGYWHRGFANQFDAMDKLKALDAPLQDHIDTLIMRIQVYLREFKKSHARMWAQPFCSKEAEIHISINTARADNALFVNVRLPGDALFETNVATYAFNYNDADVVNAMGVELDCLMHAVAGEGFQYQEIHIHQHANDKTPERKRTVLKAFHQDVVQCIGLANAVIRSSGWHDCFVKTITKHTPKNI